MSPRKCGAVAAARLQETALENPTFRPFKPREYGETKTVVSDALAQAGGAKNVAAFLGRSISVTYGYADAQAERNDLTLDQARRMTRFMGVTAFAEDMATLAGGYFTPGLPVGDVAVACASETAVDAGRAVAEMLGALADGVLTDAERAALRPHVDKLVQDAVALRNALDVRGVK